jgi:hypothetical protein
MRLHKAVPNPFRYSLSYYQNGENNYITGTPHSWNFSDIALSAGTFYCYPFFQPRDFFLKKYGIIVSVFTSGGYVHFGFYEDSKSSLLGPSALIDSADNINITATGFHSKTLANPLRLKGGKLYWGAVQTDNVIGISAKGPHRNHPFIPLYSWGWTTGTKPNGYYNGQAWTISMVNPAPATVPGLAVWRPPVLFFREPDQNGA